MSFFIYSYETTTRQESKRNIKKLLDISFEVEMQEEVEGETYFPTYYLTITEIY
jgi:hypothetical protein